MVRIIVIEEYNPQWIQSFEIIRNLLFESLNGHILDIIHVGSTSIIGLKSKPIIDIDIVANKNEYPNIINKLQEIGYNHIGNLGIADREAFSRKETTLQLSLPDHHLYLCFPKSKGLEYHLYLKEYLKIHPEAVEEYGLLKKNLAKNYKNDINQYLEGKHMLIELFITKAKTEIELSKIYDFVN